MVERPLIPLAPGEQYRFHFDMTKCIGCKCCEVACHEQNNTPAAVNWREVGEVEGGRFPHTARLYISMACNHCIEPSCLEGCPVDAYFKDPATGAVRMRDDMCIGCGYCTWNCPYEAPQFHPERRMVTKCDLCHNRLVDGHLPACVDACPSAALEIESVHIAAWVADYHAANAPAVPEASITLSTTRFTVPSNPSADLDRVDDYRLKPGKPHYALVFMLVLTQLAVGGFLALFLAELASAYLDLGVFLHAFLQIGPLAMLVTAGLALVTSVFHLGRPVFVFRAFKMWRRSWLSREVLCFALFAALAALYSGVRFVEIHMPGGLMEGLGGLAILCGLVAIYASAKIYMVPARPSWNTPRTPVAFFSTALMLGPLAALFALSFFWVEGLEHVSEALWIGKGLMALVLFAGLLQLAALLTTFFYILNRDEHELRGTAKLLVQRFSRLFLGRIGVLVLVLIGVPFGLLGLVPGGVNTEAISVWIAALLVLALASELVGRYLFFVTVVPKNRPEGYFS